VFAVQRGQTDKAGKDENGTIHRGTLSCFERWRRCGLCKFQTVHV